MVKTYRVEQEVAMGRDMISIMGKGVKESIHSNSPSAQLSQSPGDLY